MHGKRGQKAATFVAGERRTGVRDLFLAVSRFGNRQSEMLAIFFVRITEGRIRPPRGLLTPATHHGAETMKHDPVFCV